MSMNYDKYITENYHAGSHAVIGVRSTVCVSPEMAKCEPKYVADVVCSYQ
jgi:hypothetical protein